MQDSDQRSGPTGFNPGDIIEKSGECYQVLENLGSQGRVRNFPSEEAEGFILHWCDNDGTSRRMGHADLPAPSPCSTGAGCPSYSAAPLQEARRRSQRPAHIIARQT